MPPLKMHEDDRLSDLCPLERFLGVDWPSGRLESLEALTLKERRERWQGPDLDTVGDLLDYLLMADRQHDG